LVTEFIGGVRIERHWWGDCFTGTGEELVGLGVVTADMLPGAPGRNKWSVTFGKRGKPGHIRIIREGKYRFNVSRRISDEEIERRKAMKKKDHLPGSWDAVRILCGWDPRESA